MPLLSVAVHPVRFVAGPLITIPDGVVKGYLMFGAADLIWASRSASVADGFCFSQATGSKARIYSKPYRVAQQQPEMLRRGKHRQLGHLSRRTRRRRSCKTTGGISRERLDDPWTGESFAGSGGGDRNSTHRFQAHCFIDQPACSEVSRPRRSCSFQNASW